MRSKMYDFYVFRRKSLLSTESMTFDIIGKREIRSILKGFATKIIGLIGSEKNRNNVKIIEKTILEEF